MPLTTPAVVVMELATFTSILKTIGLLPMVRFGLSGTVMEAAAGPLMWTGVPLLLRKVSSELTSMRFTAEKVPCGRLPVTNGSNLPEAWVSSMRLLAGTATVIDAPPAAGVSESAETETSKAITLSAGASPRRTCADVVPGAGVGVGPGAMEALPPPPQPELRAIATNTRPVTNNRITGDNEC